MEDRKAPSPEERIQHREIDPSAYSLSSNSKLITESFDETNEIQTWTGGNTDFSDLGQDEPSRKLSSNHETDVELIHED
tara:strand:- start:100 stop:336 length:237 start_codon:yes stop_codon:yes gene_type:complete